MQAVLERFRCLTSPKVSTVDVLDGREARKEFVSAKAMFGLKRRNRIFEFFNISAPFHAATRVWEAGGNPQLAGDRGRAGPKRQKTELLNLSPIAEESEVGDRLVTESDGSGRSSGVAVEVVVAVIPIRATPPAKVAGPRASLYSGAKDSEDDVDVTWGWVGGRGEA